MTIVAVLTSAVSLIEHLFFVQNLTIIARQIRFKRLLLTKLVDSSKFQLLYQSQLKSLKHDKFIRILLRFQFREQTLMSFKDLAKVTVPRFAEALMQTDIRLRVQIIAGILPHRTRICKK